MNSYFKTFIFTENGLHLGCYFVGLGMVDAAFMVGL